MKMVFVFTLFLGISSVLTQAAESPLVSRPIPPSIHGSQYLDLDGNGTLDAIKIVFLDRLDRSYFASDVDSITFQWVDSIGRPTLVSISGKSMELVSSQPNAAYHRFANPHRFYPYLTSFDSLKFGFFGNSNLFGHVDDGSKVVYPIRVADAMPPVIRTVILTPGLDYNHPDQLVLELSEDVVLSGNRDLRNSLQVYRAKSQMIDTLFADKAWMDGNRKIKFEFSKANSKGKAPASQDSVRLIHSTFLFNEPIDCSEGKFCPANAWKVVSGYSNFKIQTSSFGKFSSPKESSKPFTVSFRKYGEFVSEDQGVGVFVNFGTPDLAQVVRDAVKSRYFASDSSVLSESIVLNPEKISMEIGLMLFSNLGEFVASHSQSFFCSNELMSDDCLKSPFQVFLKWNGLSQEGRMVASGAYLARAQLFVRYEYKPGTFADIAKVDLQEYWGIMRLSDTQTP